MSYSIAKALRQNYNLIHHILMIIQCDDYTDSQSSVVSMIWQITNYYVNHYIMKQISTNVNLQKNSVNSSIELLILCKIAGYNRQNFVGFDCRSFPLGLNTLNNARKNEIRLQLYQCYKQGRIYIVVGSLIISSSFNQEFAVTYTNFYWVFPIGWIS